MPDDEIRLTRSELAQLVREEVARAGVRQRGPGLLDDPEMAPLLGVPPRTVPVHGAAAMEEIAKQRGGLWSADNPDWRKYKACRHRDAQHCDLCWTKETEGRWAFALGLVEDPPEEGLDAPEAPRSQRANDPTRTSEAKRTGRQPANMPG